MHLQTKSIVVVMQDEELNLIQDALSICQLKQEVNSELWKKIEKILTDIGVIQDDNFKDNYTDSYDEEKPCFQDQK